MGRYDVTSTEAIWSPGPDPDPTPNPNLNLTLTQPPTLTLTSHRGDVDKMETQ